MVFTIVDKLWFVMDSSLDSTRCYKPFPEICMWLGYVYQFREKSVIL